MRKDWIEIGYKEVVNKISTNNKKLKQKEYLQKGLYPVIDQGKEIIGGYTDDELRLMDCELPVIVFGDHTKIVKLINFKFAPGADGTKVLEPKKIVLPKYLSYLTQILVFKIKDKGYARHYQHIEKQFFPLAPLPEQRAIVSKIEQLFSELDNATANLKAAKNKLEIYRQAVLKKAFEGEFNNAKIEWVALGEVCEDVEYGTSSKSEKEGDVPVLRMGNIQNGEIDWDDLKFTSDKDEIEKYRLNKGDVLFNRTNSPEHVGKTAIYKGDREAIFAGYLIRVHYQKEIVKGEYLNYYLNSHIAKEHGNKVKSFGVNQSNINGTKLKKYPFPKTLLTEQTQIVEEIETRLSVCDNILANIEEGLEKSEALRQSILKQAFEGKLLSEAELEACKKEPDWEPAEQLLTRIKAGKENPSKKEKKPASKPSKKKIHHVEYYKRTLLAAEIVWQLHQQSTLGHLKLQKLIYLCQESGNMQLPTNFLQQAAGPYDPQMARSIDKQLKTKKWFAYQKDELLKYAPLEKAGEHQGGFRKYYANDIDNIQKVIDLFKTAKSDQIEIVATLYACWKKIIEEKTVFSENLLIKRFYEWSEEKSKYPESRVKKAAEWMQEKGIVPVKAEKQTIDE